MFTEGKDVYGFKRKEKSSRKRFDLNWNVKGGNAEMDIGEYICKHREV